MRKAVVKEESSVGKSLKVKGNKSFEPESLSASSDDEEVSKPKVASKAGASSKTAPQATKTKFVRKESEDIDSSEEESVPAPVPEKRVKVSTVSQTKPVLQAKNGVKLPQKTPQKIQEEEDEEEEVEEEQAQEEEEQEEVEEEPAQEEEEEEPVQEEEEEEEIVQVPVKKEALKPVVKPVVKPVEKPVEKPTVKPVAKPTEKFWQKGATGKGETFEVFVQGVDYRATEGDLSYHFGHLPDFLSAKLLPRAEGGHTGKGFVKFSSEAGRNGALALDKTQINGREVYVSLPRGAQGVAQPGRTQAAGAESVSVIVRNLPFDADEEKLKALFADCGTVRSARVLKNEDGSSRGFGFVDFTNLEGSKKALSKVGVKVSGRAIDVQYSLQREQQAPRADFGSKPFGKRPPSNSATDFKNGTFADTKMQAFDLDD